MTVCDICLKEIKDIKQYVLAETPDDIYKIEKGVYRFLRFLKNINTRHRKCVEKITVIAEEEIKNLRNIDHKSIT